MTPPRYVHAAVGRTGLGNMLFPWARAAVFSHLHNVPILAVQWSQPKIGPLLRRETDLRYYTNLFNARGYVRGPARWAALRPSKRTDVGQTRCDTPLDQLDGDLAGRTLAFSGYDQWFADDLTHHRVFVAERLSDMLSAPVKQEIARFDAPLQIVAHIRRGDFRLLQPGEEFPEGGSGFGESETYFISVIESLRNALGRDTPVTIFSNAKPGQLQHISRLNNLHIVPPKHTAITDMLLLSRAAVLVASSTSSFSAWASYLGGMPTIWHRPWRRPLVPGKPELAIQVEPDGQLDQPAIETLHANIATAHATQPGAVA